MIYEVLDLSIGSGTWYCPDQATVDEGVNLGWAKFSTIVIGTQADAEVALVINQNAWINANIQLFSTNKAIYITGGDVAWEPVDLSTEPENTDIQYEVFDVINGYYKTALGLNDAKTLLQSTKQEYLNYYGLGAVGEYDTWPEPPGPPKPPISTGTQTL